MSDNATVIDVFNMLKTMIAKGKGDYVVTCNEEYVLAKKGDWADAFDEQKVVNLGGYDLSELN